MIQKGKKCFDCEIMDPRLPISECFREFQELSIMDCVNMLLSFRERYSPECSITFTLHPKE